MTPHQPCNSITPDCMQRSKVLCRSVAIILHGLWMTPCYLHHLGGPVEAAQRSAGSPAA